MVIWLPVNAIRLAAAPAWSQAKALVLLAVVSSASATALACDDDGMAARRARGNPRSPSSAASDDGSLARRQTEALKRALEAKLDDGGLPPDPAPAGGDLAAELARFTTLEACIVSRKLDDAVLGDALLALGYDSFARDACRIIQAAKSQRREVCSQITVSSLQRHCELVVATVGNAPDACPMDILGRSRDPSCVALASRDARLCVAVDEQERVRCEAMLAGDAKRCASAPRAGRAACERDVDRWRTVLRDEAAGKAATTPLTATGRFKFEAKNGSPLRGSGEGDLSFNLRQGVVLDVSVPRGGTGDSALQRLTFGSLGDNPSLYPSAEPGVRVEIELSPPKNGSSSAPGSGRGASTAPAKPSTDTTAARVTRLDAVIPGAGIVRVPEVESDLSVQVKHLEPQRGGVVELEVDGSIGTGTRTYSVHLEVHTFVRDAVERTASAASVDAPLSLDAGAPKGGPPLKRH